jgi:hypothetical protein
LWAPPCVAALFLLACVTARAAPITSAAALPSPVTVIDFNQFTTRVNGMGPVQVGGAVGEDVVFTSTSASAFVGITSGYGLGGNGSWVPSRGPFVGSNAATVNQTFTFNSMPVSGVGGFLNYSPGNGPDVIISALGASGVVLESYDLNLLAPISTLGQTNAGAFRGILRPAADIVAFRVSNSFVVLDDLTFTQPIPEPGSLTLLGFGVLGMLGYAWRRRERAA